MLLDRFWGETFEKQGERVCARRNDPRELWSTAEMTRMQRQPSPTLVLNGPQQSRCTGTGTGTMPPAHEATNQGSQPVCLSVYLLVLARAHRKFWPGPTWPTRPTGQPGMPATYLSVYRPRVRDCPTLCETAETLQSPSRPPHSDLVACRRRQVVETQHNTTTTRRRLPPNGLGDN